KFADSRVILAACEHAHSFLLLLDALARIEAWAAHTADFKNGLIEKRPVIGVALLALAAGGLVVCLLKDRRQRGVCGRGGLRPVEKDRAGSGGRPKDAGRIDAKRAKLLFQNGAGVIRRRIVPPFGN